MSITRSRLIGDLVPLRDAMESLFEDSFIRPGAWTSGLAGLSVPVDLWETTDAYHMKADLPGLTADDIAINATSDSVTISGELKAESTMKDEGWLRQERRTGKFQRSFSLPLQIDPNKVDATFEHGVLHLTLPKAEAVRPKSIKVRTTAGIQK